MIKKGNKKTKVINVSFISVFWVILFIYSVSIIFILAWGLLTSLKSNTDFLFMNNVLGLPNLEKSREECLKLANYRLMYDNFEFTKKVTFYSGDKLIVHETKNGILKMLFNTVVYAGVGCVLAAFVPAITAFMCVKYKQFRLSKIVYSANLIVMTLPLVGTAPATINMLRALNLYDNFFGHVLQKFSFSGMYYLVFYAFYEGLSNAYSEAAEIDGASYYRILVSIIIPLSMKMISTVMLLTFVAFWNDYQSPLLYLPTLPTLAYGVYYMSYYVTTGQISKVPVRVAGCMMLAIPIFVIFMFMRDKMMGNISIGGVKE